MALNKYLSRKKLYLPSEEELRKQIKRQQELLHYVLKGHVSSHQMNTIHRKLFAGIYSHVGGIRDYNIIKKEWSFDRATLDVNQGL